MSQKTVLVRDFTTGSVPRQLIAFALPLFLSNLLQIAYNMVDMIVVGRVCGSAGLSAVSIGGDVSNLLTFVGMGFANAGQVIIAQYIGAGRRDRIGRFVGTMVCSLLTVALVLSVAGLLLRRQILQWMSTPSESFDEALRYATVCMIGLVFIYTYNIVSAILRGIGDSKRPLVFIGIAALTNLVLDLVLVIGLNMGALGAALATVIGQAVSVVCSVTYLIRRRDKLGFAIDRRCFRIEGHSLLMLVRLGVPMAIKFAAVQFSKLFVNSWVNSYGLSVSAVAGIANKLTSVSNLIANAMNTAGSSMVGQNIGAGRYERVPKILLTAFAVNFSIASVLITCMLLFPENIFGIFNSEPSVLAVCMQYLPMAVLVFFSASFRSSMNALINGSGNYKVNFAVALLDGIFIRIGLSLLFGLGLGMGYVGFWLGDAVAGFTPFVIGIVYYLTGRWKTGRYVQ